MTFTPNLLDDTRAWDRFVGNLSIRSRPSRTDVTPTPHRAIRTPDRAHPSGAARIGAAPTGQTPTGPAAAQGGPS